MHDEKLEQRSGSEALEAGIAGEDGGLEKRVLFKMDVRYVSFPFLPIPCLLLRWKVCVADYIPGYCPSSRYYSCVPSSTARMSETPRFWGWRRIYISMTINMLLVFVCFTLRILRGEYFSCCAKYH
jgi:hypothetical protein